MPTKKQDFSHILISSFNNSFFISLLILSITGKLFVSMGLKPYLLPFVNGFLSLFATIILYLLFHKKKYFRTYSKKYIKPVLAVSFITGLLSVYMATYNVATFLISILITSLTIKNIKIFAKKIAMLLDVKRVASTKDLIEFFDFFISLILTFTVINLSLYVAHVTMKAPPAFGFDSEYTAVIDSLYFTIITMTTLGFGDVVPKTELAKIIVSIQCLISYTMFGLMIGIVSRGIDFNKKS